MPTYRATLRPQSATRSPWQADMLFGHLCWLILHEEGEDALNRFLAPYRAGTPPLLFSDGFPGDLLPKPLLPPAPMKRERSKALRIASMQQAKTNKSIRWIDLQEFDSLRRGISQPLVARPDVVATRAVLKNQINRLTGGTTPVEEGAGGNLYSAQEIAFADRSGEQPVGVDLSVYVWAQDEQWARQAENLLRRLARAGYGARKSTGYGQFRLHGWVPFPEWDQPIPNANGFICLSNWVPKPGDPVDGAYSVFVKYGKLGEEFAGSENPFKFPLQMITTGSSFYASPPILQSYGRLVDNIAPAHSAVVHYGYAFALPLRIVEQRV